MNNHRILGTKWFSNTLHIAYITGIWLLHILPAIFFPSERVAQVLPFRADSLIHLLMFTPWMLLDGHLFTGGKRGRASQRLHWLAYGIFACFFFESCQLLTDSRAFDLTDIAWDLTGLTTGALIAIALHFFTARRKPDNI